MSIRTQFCLTVVLLLDVGCSKDDGETTKEKAQRMLTAATWEMSSVLVDGTDRSDLFDNMTLDFSAQTYSASNGGTIWNSSGTWAFADDTGSSMTIDNGLTVIVEELGENQLSLSLTWTKNSLGSGRSSSVSGRHVFSFTH